MLVMIISSLLALSVIAEHHTFYWTVGLGLEAPDCVVRDVVEINAQFIGPEIRVSQGDDITVHVFNLVPAIEVTIHWHGIEQDDPWMDGHDQAQCPIHFGHNFTYSLHIPEDHYPGTYWYHFHNNGLRANGGYGAFIVEPSFRSLRPEPAELLAADSEQTLLIQDWNHANFMRFNALWTGMGIWRPEAYFGETLIFNGKGRWDCESYPLSEPNYCLDWEAGECGALERVRGNMNDTVRLRLVNVGFQAIFGIKIESHAMTILQVDGFPVEPYTVDLLMVSPGQRYDVLVSFNQPSGVYWIGGETIHEPPIGNDLDFLRGFAILEYGDQGSSEPQTNQSDVVATIDDMLATFNRTLAVEQSKALKPHEIVDEYPPTANEVTTRIHLQFVEAKALYDPVDLKFVPGSFEEEDPEYQELKEKVINMSSSLDYLNYSFGLDEHPRFDENFIVPVFLARESGGEWGVFKTGFPSQLDIVMGGDGPFEQSTEVEVGEVVEIVLEFASIAYKPVVGCLAHSFHIHGHKPWVVAMGEGPFPGDNLTYFENVIRRDSWKIIASGRYANTDGTSRRDIVTQMGKMCNWAVIRFRMYKPGVFPLHCHSGPHNAQRQRWDFIVGREQIPPPPAGVEICGINLEDEYCSTESVEQRDVMIVGSFALLVFLILMNTCILCFLCCGHRARKKEPKIIGTLGL